METMQVNKEIKRQVLHLVIGILIIAFYILCPKTTVLIVLFLVFLASIILSIISRKVKIPGISWFLRQMGREQERTFPGKGWIFFFAGTLLVIKLFSRDIALASIIVLTIGDSISTLTGLAFSHRYKTKPFSRFKTIYGTLIGFVMSAALACIFISPVYAVAGAAIGMFAEALAIKLGQSEADDNLIIPLAAGTAMYLLRLVLH